ncbi:hypothetical protein [Cellulomonas sp. SLBN-39]|uniref:hypothetical protein n=1 Tax=Cellulomonas sp. SLBN-39 TaxID=2768446 RepID=UPI001150485C|nr:hypothetical protein [Cellulomonas sp. SLBN-39]TQL01795.1 hypothetical protein FBY24_0854 [Cellulomonas sp. SLBN-39]
MSISAVVLPASPRPPAPRPPDSGATGTGRIVLTDSGRTRLAQADIRPARNAQESRLLAEMTATDQPGRASQLLRRLSGDESLGAPDYVAVRSGAEVTPAFAGGGTVWGVTFDDTQMTFFGAGEPPEAAKGVAIIFGAETTPPDQDTLTRWAMSWLTEHLDDAPIGGGQWNRPLIDITA